MLARDGNNIANNLILTPIKKFETVVHFAFLRYILKVHVWDTLSSVHFLQLKTVFNILHRKLLGIFIYFLCRDCVGDWTVGESRYDQC